MIKAETTIENWESRDYEFDRIAENVFYPIYDVIADDILLKIKSREGKMLDLGCGGGHLGMALLSKTAHEGYFVDINEKAVEIAQHRAEERGLSDRTFFSKQDVHKMDFPDGFFDLIISRGSYGFWEDIEAAFLEIYRILAPGGRTYIGGGLGNAELSASIHEKMAVLEPGWPARLNKTNITEKIDRLVKMLAAREIDYELIDNKAQGHWFILKK